MNPIRDSNGALDLKHIQETLRKSAALPPTIRKIERPAGRIGVTVHEGLMSIPRPQGRIGMTIHEGLIPLKGKGKEKASPPSPTTFQEEEITNPIARCLHCKTNREFQPDWDIISGDKGRKRIKGKCVVCNSGMNRYIS